MSNLNNLYRKQNERIFSGSETDFRKTVPPHGKEVEMWRFVSIERVTAWSKLFRFVFEFYSKVCWYKIFSEIKFSGPFRIKRDFYLAFRSNKHVN